MRSNHPSFFCLLLIAALLAACSPAATALPPVVPGAPATWAAETLQAAGATKTVEAQLAAAELTRQAPPPTFTPLPTRPTATPMPTNTLQAALFLTTTPRITPSATTSAALIEIATATLAPFADFEFTFSNAHRCGYDKYLIFRIENTGNMTLYVATITITEKKGKTLHSDILWAPYMLEANHCPPGRYALEMNQRGFAYIKKVDGIQSGARLRAHVKICTQDGPDQKCIEKEILFSF